MEIRKLEGGKVIGVNQDRLQIPLYADPPKLRVGSPGTVAGNVGIHLQLHECSKLEHGKPEPTMVKVVFREMNGEILLVMAPTWQAGDDVYELKYDSGKAPVVRGLKLLFDAAGIQLRRGFWYEMETEIVQDETFGHAVVGNWTKATIRPQKESEKDAAAGQQAEQ